MNAGRRVHVGTASLLVVAAVIVGLLWAWAFTLPPTDSAAASSGPSSAASLAGPAPGRYAGSGFDACSAPPQDVMTTWLAESPYRAVGIYMGGVNRFCLQPELTASWVSTQQAAGWHLIPIYLGQQPYCTTSQKIHRFTATDAATWGRADAADAVVQARALGLATDSAIFNDIEAYSTTDQVCRTAVLTYQSAWTARLHDFGFASGFYSSLGSGVSDQVAVYGSTTYVRPDYLWFARYDGVPSVLDTSSPQVLPDSYWSQRRIKQYRGGAYEAYDGQPPPPGLNVDRDQLEVTPLPATAFGDFNGNGWSDLLTRQTSTGSLLLYAGNGTGFASAHRFGGGWNAMSSITRFGDFNRDGHEDLIARELATGALWLYRGTGSGFYSRLKIGVGGWNSMREITPVGDLDGDGYPDLLAVQSSNGYMYLYPGRGTSLGPRRALGGGWNSMSELAGVGDFNRDGHVDLLARNTATGDVWLYKGTGTALGARVRVATGWSTLRDVTGVGDFDRDGLTDVIAVESATGKLFRYPGRGTSFGPRLAAGGGWTVLQPLL
ncbi:MAG TPA: glycoside hydrolase domain-containing protein [Dermatophilaceae bacterium]